jgi:hypothetical protein
MKPKTINEFWFEYVPCAREMFLNGAPVDCEADPLLAIFYDIFGVIDASIADALQKGYTQFTPTTRTNRDKTKCMVLVFSGGPLPAMRRQVPFQQERINALRPGFRVSDFLDLKIVLQSMIVNEGKIKVK